MEKSKLYGLGYSVDHAENEEFAFANLVLRMPDNRVVIGMAHGRNINRAFAYALRKLADEILEKYTEADNPIYAYDVAIEE
jgi:hypothetical protein